jgi:hypothetical protein
VIDVRDLEPQAGRGGRDDEQVEQSLQ